MRETIIKSEVERTKSISKWNFNMGVLHGTFFTGGMALANPDTILPVFLSNFTASKVVIGLFSSLMGSLGNIVSALPQMVVANRLENKVHKIPVLRLAIVIRALCWGFLSLTTYLFAVSHPKLTLYLIFSLLFIFTFMGGIATIPFMDIWGKSLPSTLRGRFLYVQILGGAGALSLPFYILYAKDILKIKLGMVGILLLA